MIPPTRWSSSLQRYRAGEWRATIFRDLVLQDIRRHAPATVLDIGCGRGFDDDLVLQESVARAAGRYIGVEPDPAVATGSYFSAVHRCRFEDVPLPPQSVDVAFAIMVLEHLPTPQAFWDKLWEVLVEGGVFWGLTVDRRHWFCAASLWAERLRIKDLYLTALLGARGTDRYENYPVYYRSNSPEQVRHQARRFRACEVVNLARVGQTNDALPRCLHRLAESLDRRALRKGRPGPLLVIRAIK